MSLKKNPIELWIDGIFSIKNRNAGKDEKEKFDIL